MGQQINHLNQIVEQVLDLARRTEPKPAPVDVNKLIEDLGLLTRHKLRAQRIELIHRLAPGLPLLMADPVQLEQAFLNLILTAAQAMPDGGRLTLTTRPLAPRRNRRPTHVAVEVKDTGIGMTEEQCRRAFTSLLSTTRPQGTGLGLAIVRRVVETHRGEVTVKSKPGRGTTMTVTLPVGSE